MGKDFAGIEPLNPPPIVRPKRPLKRSGRARAEGQRKIAFDAQPAEFLVAMMQGEVPKGADEPASLKERIDIAKFLTNKLVGNAAQHQGEDGQGVANADWVKQIEAQSVDNRHNSTVEGRAIDGGE